MKSGETGFGEAFGPERAFTLLEDRRAAYFKSWVVLSSGQRPTAISSHKSWAVSGVPTRRGITEIGIEVFGLYLKCRRSTLMAPG